MNRTKRVWVALGSAVILVGLFYTYAERNLKREVGANGEGGPLSRILSPTPPDYIQIGEGTQERKGTLVKAELELPFLGKIECLSADYRVSADRLSPLDQTWRLFWTTDGSFLGADFTKPGFVETPFDKRHIESVYTARTERIVGLVRVEPQIRLSHLRRIAAEHADFGKDPIGIQRITIRRALYSSETISPEAEVYIMTVWAKGVLVTPSWSSDAGRIVIDSKGNGLIMDNGY